MNKYQNGKIYKLVCDNSPLIYYGSTIQKLSNRLSSHKSECKRRNCGSKELFQLGKVSIHEIEKYPCNSKKELEDKERIYIEFILKNFDYKIICNKKIPSRNQKEYYRDNPNIMKEYKQKNKESIKKQSSKKFNCPCGGKYTNKNKQQHFKTKKHLNYLEEQK